MRMNDDNYTPFTRRNWLDERTTSALDEPVW